MKNRMLLIADNIQVIDPRIAEALQREDPQPITRLVRHCEAAGAEGIDINAGPLGKEAARKMTFLVETVQAASTLPLFLDTVNPIALEAGLAACRGRAVINGFSLQQEKLEKILPLAKIYGSEIVGFLLHPDSSVPRDAPSRLTLAVELYERAVQAGVEPEQLVIDPVIVPVLWHDGAAQAKEVLETIRTLPELLGFPVRTIAGLSNLTTGKGERRKKLLLERSYAAMLAAAGLDMALINVMHGETVATIRASNLLASTAIFNWENL